MPGLGYTFNSDEKQRIKDYINIWLAEHNNTLDGVSWRDLVFASGKVNVGDGSLRVFGIDNFNDFMNVLDLEEYLDTDRENAFRAIYGAAANPQSENSQMQPAQGGRRRNRRGRKTAKKSKRRTKHKRRHTRRHHR
jgi:hypothetical protein